MDSKTAAKCLLFAVQLLHVFHIFGCDPQHEDVNLATGILRYNEAANSATLDIEEIGGSDDTMIAIDWNDSEFETMIEQNTIDAQLNPNLSKFVDEVVFKFWTISSNNTLSNTPFTLHDKATIESLWLQKKRLKVVIHGWLNSAEDPDGVYRITKAYAKQFGMFNVISVDWKSIAGKLNYKIVAKSCQKIGVIVGQLLVNLKNLKLVKPTMMHVIGHGVGAHIAGLAGRTYTRVKNTKLTRITGLDPPSQGFEYSWMFQTVNEGLDQTRASFVDVIKTTSHLISINARVGHAEFHPNYGTAYQPGCLDVLPINTWVCSHMRAIDYYEESVYLGHHFESLKCSSIESFTSGKGKDSKKSNMGNDADPGVQGDFYLITNDKTPYSAPLPTWENVEKSKPRKQLQLLRKSSTIKKDFQIFEYDNQHEDVNLATGILRYNEAETSSTLDIEEIGGSDDTMNWNDTEFETMIEQNTIDAQLNPNLSKFVDEVVFKIWTISSNFPLFNTPFKLHDEATIESLWLPKKPLKVVIHGWLSSAEDPAGVYRITEVYAKQIGMYNVISVDWKSIAGILNYKIVAKSCQKIGVIVGQLLVNLKNLNLVKPTMMHVIGHGVGAHIAGLAGRTYTRVKNTKLTRITGLDPPSQGFEYSWMFQAVTEGLDQTHASFVDVIKTTSHLISINARVGHAEFHPNYGTAYQPGCLDELPIDAWVCSHMRAIVYYQESVYWGKDFESLKCSSIESFTSGECSNSERSHMGHNADPSVQGDFYLITYEKTPYSAPLPTSENVETSKPRIQPQLLKKRSSIKKGQKIYSSL